MEQILLDIIPYMNSTWTQAQISTKEDICWGAGIKENDGGGEFK
jgi:hypothetical protein